MRIVCVSAVELCISPGIDFIFNRFFGESFFGRYAISFKAGAWLGGYFLSFGELFFLFVLIDALGIFGEVRRRVSIAEIVVRSMFFFAVSDHDFSSVGVGEEVLFLFEGGVVSGIVFSDLFFSLDALVFVSAGERWARFGLICLGCRMLDGMFSCLRDVLR